VIRVVFWDIDGTLLTTARAGVFALEDAAREVLGADASFAELRTSGLTDWDVAALAIRTVGGLDEAPTVEAFLRAYERFLPERLHMRRGEVLPGVVEILDHLDRREDVLNLLLTGNTPGGARAKLAHYGIERYFEGGAFCVDGVERVEIARRALTLAAERIGADPERDAVTVVGDTPADVRCGHAIGARTVAVASGAYSREQLEACAPSVVLDRFPQPPQFEAILISPSG
jgi:phosphoglycolate phosphatase-like HAD superfamily hydrolase